MNPDWDGVMKARAREDKTTVEKPLMVLKRSYASPMSDHEHRMGVVPLETLLAERDTLVKQVAPLRAKYGAWGTFEALRKIRLAQLAQLKRAELLRDGERLTEAAIEDAAHADERYVDFVTQATSERATWAVLENRVQGITDTIMRGQSVARFVTAETALLRENIIPSRDP